MTHKDDTFKIKQEAMKIKPQKMTIFLLLFLIIYTGAFPTLT